MAPLYLEPHDFSRGSRQKEKYTQQQERTKCFCEDNKGALLVGISWHFHHPPRT